MIGHAGGPRTRSRRSRLLVGVARLMAAVLVAGTVGLGIVPGTAVPPAAAGGCRIYVAAGDDIPAGHDLNDDAARYPEKLGKDHLGLPGWCVYNQGANGQTSSTFLTAGGLSRAYNMRPDLLTIQLGEQNNTVVNLIKSCFDKVKDHEFASANACAAQIEANQTLFDDLRKHYTTILQYTRIMASQRPELVVAVVNYPNPYPDAVKAQPKVFELCQAVIDSMNSCLQRWMQLPPALERIDSVFKKLNKTLKDALVPFQTGPNGYRWIYVDAYPKFEGHEMKMQVTLRLDVVCHLCGTQAQYIDTHSGTVNFGSDDAWWIEGTTGTKFPSYMMTPGPFINPPVVIQQVSQQTVGMGVWVDADGQKCIADAIWDADSILPGTSPLKWHLGYGEEASTTVCQ